MKSGKRTFLVFNATDGFYASPDRMTKEEAETFIKQFPERYRAQGYYRTGRWEKIRPEDVELEIMSITEKLDKRMEEVKTMRQSKQKSKGINR
jgi:hypothetical protein